MFIRYADGTIVTGATGIPERATDVQAIEAKASAALVHVYMGGYVGSAFFVDLPASEFPMLDTVTYDYILTAAHVITDDNSGTLQTISLQVNTPENELIRNIPSYSSTVIYSTKADIALLRVEAKPGRVKLPLCPLTGPDTPKISDEVFIAGWTLGFDMQNFTATRIKEIGFDITYNTVNGYESSPIDSMLCDSNTMAGGNSGGPWIDRFGQVVGITSWGYSKGETFSETQLEYSQSFDMFAVSWRSVHALLSKINGSQTFPIRFVGKKLADYKLAMPTSVAEAVGTFTFLGDLRGYTLYDNDSAKVINRVLTHVDGQVLGQLNGQQRLALAVYYSDADTLDCTFTNSGGETPGSLALSVRDVNSGEENTFALRHKVE